MPKRGKPWEILVWEVLETIDYPACRSLTRTSNISTVSLRFSHGFRRVFPQVFPRCSCAFGLRAGFVPRVTAALALWDRSRAPWPASRYYRSKCCARRVPRNRYRCGAGRRRGPGPLAIGRGLYALPSGWRQNTTEAICFSFSWAGMNPHPREVGLQTLSGVSRTDRERSSQLRLRTVMTLSCDNMYHGWRYTLVAFVRWLRLTPSGVDDVLMQRRGCGQPVGRGGVR